MKSFILVLFSLIGLFSSGCAVTAFTGNLPPAGLEVTNNVANSFVTLHTSRTSDVAVKLATGQTTKIPICGLPVGSNYTVTAKFWDTQSGAYLGTAVQSFSVWLDQGGRYNETWLLTGYIPPSQSYGGSSVSIAPSQVIFIPSTYRY